MAKKKSAKKKSDDQSATDPEASTDPAKSEAPKRQVVDGPSLPVGADVACARAFPLQ